jgi:aerobic-type carbon monoxide dehydrogenase small subunit (CoxS/CutS family)
LSDAPSSKPASRWADRRPREIEVSCTVDGVALTIATWSDMSALLALRLGAGLATPRRGCEAGQCGACESIVNGALVRVCQLSAAALDGAVVRTQS